ncbi:MAG TPA: M28 family metallopeptidase [Candidatus Acidoferrum sp.]|nr:M28 family metallopeptidase [Candidatus Acidoferrum sp.]
MRREARSGARLAAAICCALCAAAIWAQNDWQAEGNAWWAHVQYLASDELQGRLTGSEGYRKAADYVAKQFKEAGLAPAGTDDYFQPIDFDVRELDEAHSMLSLVSNGMEEPLKLGEDATLSVRGEPGARVNAGAIFVGYGFAVPEMNYDDLAGLDLKGKIAVYISGGPKSIPSALKAHYQSGEERWKRMQSAGAIGEAVIANPKATDIPWERSSKARFQPSMTVAAPSTGGANNPRILATINAAHADEWLAGTNHTIAELLGDADSDTTLPKFALKVSVRARVAVRESKVKAPNVLGVLRGSDPTLKNEYVVVSAHLDHLGVGEPINGDSIYNGAMDNATGIASLIEVAKHFKAAGTKPRRSVIFAAVTAEEKGELGSKYFAAHPTVDIRKIVADLNMDMYLPLFPLKYLEVQGLDESTLGDDIRAVAGAQGVTVQADKEPDKNRFIRSDQYSFVKMGIPALAFKFGWVPGTAEEKTFQEWIRVRYHAPSDDINQPVDAAAAAQFNHILMLLLERVADADARPEWKPTSFFRRFAQK